MNPALSLLLLLRLKGFFRRWLTGLRTPKRLLLTLVGVLMFVPWLLSVTVSNRGLVPVPVESVTRYGPYALLAYAVLTLFFSSGERMLYFTPAEISFLFTGPFRQRELLSYKLVAIWFGTLFSALIFTLVLPYLRPNPYSGFLGLYLALMFYQLGVIVVNLAVSLAGVLARTRLRQIVLIFVVILLGSAIQRVGRNAIEIPPSELFARVEASPIVNAAVAPFRPFVAVFVAPRVGPSMLGAVGICLAMLAAETLVIFLLNASYLEAVAASSEKLYLRIQRAKRGGSFNLSRVGEQPKASGGKPRLELKDFPYWGGVGPVVWRQVLAALRDPVRLVVPLLLLLVPGAILAAAKSSKEGLSPSFIFVAEGMVLYITVFLTPVIPFDFRGDIDRMETLKTLPIPSWALAAGQLIVPTLILSLPQALMLAFAAIAIGVAEPSKYVALLLLIPAVFQIIAVENLMFLLFPTRLSSGGAADLTVLGRHLILMMGKLLLVAATYGLCALLGLCFWWIFPSTHVPAFAAALVGLMLISAAMIPFVAAAYDRYDVARDTPA